MSFDFQIKQKKRYPPSKVMTDWDTKSVISVLIVATSRNDGDDHLFPVYDVDQTVFFVEPS